ncbi:hypothetical protein [Spirosoma flavum]|uniref:Uncharacterized protein n=1 Tax=Spirosoma flavum TaxID=2048557 RepID=A0ABW6AIY4_9BACT
MQSESLELWKKNLHEAIRNIADLNSQRIIWLGRSLDYESSFDEYMMSLFDDFDIERFISKESWPNMKLPESLRLEIEQLIMEFNSYRVKATDKEILEDPEWHKITNQAREVIQNWDKNR